MAGASGDCPAPRQLTPSPPASRLPQRPRFELLQTGQPATQALGITSVPAQGTPCPASLAVSAAAPTRQRTGRLGLSPSGWAGRRNSIRNERPRPAPGAPCRGPGEAACRTVPPPCGARREARGVPAVRVPPAAPAAWLRLPAYAPDPERRRGQRQGAGHCHRHKARPRDVRTMPRGDAPRGRPVFLTAPCPRDVSAGSGPVTGTEARTLHGAEQHDAAAARPRTRAPSSSISPLEARPEPGDTRAPCHGGCCFAGSGNLR